MSPDAIAWVLLGFTCVLFGVGILRRLALRLDDLDGLAWATALGTGALSLWIFVLLATGMWGLAGSSVAARLGLVLAPALVLAALDVRTRRQADGVARIDADPARAATRGRVSPHAVLPALVALGLLLASLGPETGHDALVYHLPAAARAGRDGLGPMVGVLDGEFRLGFDLLFAPLLALDGRVPRGPAFLHALCGVALAAGVAAEVARRAGAAVAGAVATLLLLAPEVARLCTTAYVDLAVGLYSFLAIGALARSLRGEAGPWLVLAGALAGFATNAKQHALGLLLAVALGHLAGARGPRTWRGALLVVAVGGAVALPWFVRALLNTTNPLFPLASGVFGTGWADPGSVALATRTVLDQTGLPRDLTLPLRGLFHGVFDPAFGHAVPAFVVALAPAALVRPDTPERRGLLVAGAVATLLWLAFVPLARFGLAPLAWGAVAAGVGVARLVRSSSSPAGRRRAALLAAGVALTLAALDAVALRRLPARLAELGPNAPWSPETARLLDAPLRAARVARGPGLPPAGRVGLASHGLALVGPDAVSLTPQRNGMMTEAHLSDPRSFLEACRRLDVVALVVPVADGTDAHAPERLRRWAQLVEGLMDLGVVGKAYPPRLGYRRLDLRPRVP